MPSPFPGMDPFIEGQLSKGFSTPFRAVISEMLVAQVRPRYIVDIEEDVHQKFLSIRNRQSRNVVTVIELLSPTNKTPGGGRTEYLARRNKVFYGKAHLVEIDLLRGGQRLPTREPLAPADFYAFVCRTERLPKVEVYGWTLRDRLPVIPIPLAAGDADVPLDLQAAFTTTYDRCGYDYSLDYGLPVEPALDSAAADWVQSVIEKRSNR